MNQAKKERERRRERGERRREREREAGRLLILPGSPSPPSLSLSLFPDRVKQEQTLFRDLAGGEIVMESKQFRKLHTTQKFSF